MCDFLEARVVKWDVDWLEIKNLCRTTISMGDSKVEPTKEWKRKLLLAEHSPLRHSLITVELKDIPYYVSTHLVRHHMGVEKYVGTSREDRTGVDRSERRQTDLVTMRMDLNIQALINISRKRLCMQADEKTILAWSLLLNAIHEYDEDVYWACVPEGIRSCGCPEGFGHCRRCQQLLSGLTKEQLFNIEKRYNEYHAKKLTLKR